MSKYAISMISSCLDGVVTHRDGTPLASPQTIEDYVSETPDVEVYDNDGMAWPDIEFNNLSAAPALTISGITFTAELIAGSHRPHRPK